jgi:hypothetical protein
MKNNNMDKIRAYDDFPLWIPLFAIVISAISYGIGAVILSGFGIIFSVLYIIYCISVELMVIYRSCKNCWYYGKKCGLGKGRIAPLFFKKGDTKKFADRDISMIHMIPDFMVIIFPLVGGIILLIFEFSIITLFLMIILAVLFFSGTAFIRSTFACKYCKQKDIGCPADELFNKREK